MPNTIDTLETSVIAAATMIAKLRERVSRLERELSDCRSELPPHSVTPPTQEIHALSEELGRLRAERVEVRERIRGLLKEIDRVYR